MSSEDKSLRDRAIDIKGKQYVLVADRLAYFTEYYPGGSIKTELLSAPSDDMVVMKATVTPEPENPNWCYTGHSQAKWGEGYINKTSALENAETSAVGRALAMMGVGVIESVASADEVNKAENSEKFQTGAERVEVKMQKSLAKHSECPAGTPFSILESHSTNNFGRKYKKCSKCGEFIGWYADPTSVSPEKTDAELGF